MPGLNDQLNQLKRVRKQIPFAVAQALARVAKQIKEAQTTAIKRTFDNPTSFTANSVRAQGARKDNLKARVFIMDTAAGYLEPLESGGMHKLNGRALLNPKGIRLNKYGNLGSRKMSQSKNDNTFIGEVKSVDGLWRHKTVTAWKARGWLVMHGDDIDVEASNANLDRYRKTVTRPEKKRQVTNRVTKQVTVLQVTSRLTKKRQILLNRRPKLSSA